MAALFKNIPFAGGQLNLFGLLSTFRPTLGNSDLRPGGAMEIFEVLLELLANFHVFYKASFFVFTQLRLLLNPRFDFLRRKVTDREPIFCRLNYMRRKFLTFCGLLWLARFIIFGRKWTSETDLNGAVALPAASALFVVRVHVRPWIEQGKHLLLGRLRLTVASLCATVASRLG